MWNKSANKIANFPLKVLDMKKKLRNFPPQNDHFGSFDATLLEKKQSLYNKKITRIIFYETSANGIIGGHGDILSQQRLYCY